MADSKRPGEEFEHVTTAHSEVRRWARQRGGQPAAVVEDGELQRLLVEFPGDRVRGATRIDWADFFDWFDERDLAFAYTRGEGMEPLSETYRLLDRIHTDALDDDGTPEQRKQHRTARERAEKRRAEREVERRSERREEAARDQENVDNHRDEPPFNS